MGGRARADTMIVALLLLLLPAPALAVAPHSGEIATRSMPELSDLVLFVLAAFGVFLARRALRRRFRAKAQRRD
ncbi:hypothetical protein [Sphingosinithalassobacter sp. LHW66-3]|uniref:hypothetical protein n=1 Tax=Sphingosinithalassobacter sp. LHW66-3 TaxID=3424718 RepID=UPI003D6AAB07